jgi:hypothetical protein
MNQPWLNLNYYLSAHLEELRRTVKILRNEIGIPAEVWTRHLSSWVKNFTAWVNFLKYWAPYVTYLQHMNASSFIVMHKGFEVCK